MSSPDIMTCGSCGRSWDDGIVTSMTPVPSGRCPFEGFDDGEPIPADWPVQPVRLSVCAGCGQAECTGDGCEAGP